MIELRRYGSTPQGTFGELSIDGRFFCYTVEKPWNDNIRSHSCFPNGVYELQPHDSPKYGKCFCVVGEHLKHTLSECIADTDRWGCLIHTANKAEEVKGCIGLGETLGALGHKWAVMNSRETVDRFHERVNLDIPHVLYVTEQP